MEIISNVIKITQARLCCPTLEQIGSVTLFDLPSSFFDKAKNEYKMRRDAAFEALHSINGVICTKPGGAFYITCKLPVPSAHDFLMWMLKLTIIMKL